jgi:hypothetical protein
MGAAELARFRVTSDLTLKGHVFIITPVCEKTGSRRKVKIDLPPEKTVRMNCVLVH